MFSVYALYTLVAIGAAYMLKSALGCLLAFYRHFLRQPLNFKKRYGEGFVVITGGAEGIGRTFAEYFAARGFQILIVDCNKTLLAATSNSIVRRFKVKCVTIEADLSTYSFNSQIFEQLATEIKDKIGGDRVVGLVNNVGCNYIESFDKIPTETLDSLINLNVLPATHLTQKLLPDIKGFVVFTNCYAGMTSTPFHQQFSATKAYTAALAARIAKESRDLDVLTVHPMTVSTTMGQNAEPSFTVATTDEVVNGAMKELGRRTVCIGSWKQTLAHWISTCIPEILYEPYKKSQADEILAEARATRAAKTNSNQQMATLHYFDIFGRGEPIRLFFAYTKTEYTNRIVQFEEWPELKQSEFSETGYLPVLEIDDMKLVGYWSILRYLAQKSGQMYPSDPYEVYQLESLHDLIQDIIDAIMKKIAQNDFAGVQAWIDENIATKLKFIENRLVANGGGDGWFVGDSVSLVDLDVFSLIHDMFLRPSKREVGEQYFSECPKLLAFAQRFLNSVPEFKEYVESRDDSKRV